MGISVNFNMFCDELEISEKKKSIISLRYNSINKKLNNDFWNINTNYGGIYIGCYGRETANDGIKEVEMIFEMPSHLLVEYKECGGNPQARFLEDVRRSITSIYSKTSIDKDKQSIKIQFSDGMLFRVFPAFIKDGGGYVFADLTDDGQWNIHKPKSLQEAIKHVDATTHHNLRKLCKMVKAWKQNCKVRIKDVLIDELVYEFLLYSKKRYLSYLNFDIMCLDFFEFLMNQEPSKTTWNIVGSDQKIHNPDNFRYKAIVAHFKAENAIKLEHSGRKWNATQKWKEIFGYRFPESVKVESQLKKLYERATSLYEAQKKCVRILNQKVMTFKGLQLLIAVLIVSAILIIGFTEEFDLGLGLFMISSVMFLVVLYFQKYNLGNISMRHKQSALRTFLIKQEFQSLLIDLNRSDLDISVIRKRKDELQRKMTDVYRGTSKSIDRRYAKALENIHMISKIKKKLSIVKSGQVNIPVWQSNKFNMENSVQCLMNYRNQEV
ncbi:SMODS domain-containing nucleotidyltransferase [Aquimarina rubra]|uniref:SMODS and SLOG-associating 2TM effector domain-containing protein n=1 Tax=Aquimarina rubra TaxID=1920033 RepID=A0ABW5LJ16_9FLAO